MKLISSLFLNTPSCYQKSICDNLFNANESSIKTGLTEDSTE